MALDAAIAGHGVVLAYSTIAAADLAAGRLVRLFSLALPDLFAYYIVTAPGARERPKVRAFRNWLRQEATDAGGAGGGQCRKWRRPVNTIAMPARSAAAMTSASRREPPGWIAAVAPAAIAASSPSANG